MPGHARLSPDALLQVAEALHADAALKLLYTDEDRMEDDGRRHTPWMKGEWNPELAFSGLFPGQLAFFAKDVFLPLGFISSGIRPRSGLRSFAAHGRQVAIHASAASALRVLPRACQRAARNRTGRSVHRTGAKSAG